MSASLDLPDADWVLVQLSGTWARERHVVERRLAPGRQSVGSLRGASSARAEPVHRPSSPGDDRGGRRGLRLQPRLLGQLPRRGRGRSAVDDARPDRDRSRGLRMAPRARRGARPARGGPGLRVGRARWPERRLPRPLPRAARPGTLARPAPARPPQQLGGHLLRLRRAEAGRDGDGGPRPRRRAVRPRRRLVRRARRRHDLARRLVRRPAQAAGRPRWARRPDRGARAPVRAVDRAGDGQRRRASCSTSTPTGRSASPAGRGPRAASSSSSTCPGRRSSTTSSGSCRDVLGSAPIVLREVGHEPVHHRAVQPRPPARPPGRVLPPLRPRASTSCIGG